MAAGYFGLLMGLLMSTTLASPDYLILAATGAHWLNQLPYAIRLFT